GLGAVEARNGDFQFDSDGKAGAFGIFTKGNSGIDSGVVRNLHLFTTGDGLESAEETGGITGREELLGIGAGTIIAAHGLWRIKGDFEAAVVGLAGAAGAASGG